MARTKPGAGKNFDKEVDSLKALRPPRVTKEPKENRSPCSRKGSGYRNKTDVYRKVSYFLTHEQADLVKKEAELRGQEISEFFRSVVDFYYRKNPLTPERVRELMEERIQREVAAMEAGEED